MSVRHLATYLNDHVAGSVAGLELLGYLRPLYRGSATEQTLANLQADILADRQELEAFMGRMHISVSGTRKVGAWLHEKLAELKMRADDPEEGSLRRLEALEALGLGIMGKRALWTALAEAWKDSPELADTDFAGLEQRAEDQYRRVEELRMEAARAALRGEQSSRTNLATNISEGY